MGTLLQDTRYGLRQSRKNPGFGLDVRAFIGVAVVLLATAMLACYIPARRAALVDSMLALRYE